MAVPPAAPQPPAAPPPPPQPPTPADPLASSSGTAYHRLGVLDPKQAWWKPILCLLLAAAIFFALNFGVGLLWMFSRLAAGESPAPSMGPNGYPVGMFEHPMDFFFLFFSIVLMLPSVLLARLACGPRPLGALWSVVGRIRWRWLLTCLLVALVVLLVLQFGLGALLPSETTQEVRLSPGNGLILAMILVLVPLQCAAEEVAFRGLPMQSIGRWLKHPVWAVLIPVPFFVLGHGYGPWGQVSVGVLAVAAGILAVTTGGLEASIALHVVNNLLALLLGWVGVSNAFDQTDTTAVDALLAAVIDAAYVAVVLWLVRRRRVAVRTGPTGDAALSGGRPSPDPR